MDIGNAGFSSCERYRYVLSRLWDAGLPRVMFCMLNPSKADAWKDDPTIRRCIKFAMSWGYGGLWIGNIFAWRSTDPMAMLDQIDPIGPHNDEALEWMARDCDRIIVAWGAFRLATMRGAQVMTMLQSKIPGGIWMLRATKTGMPQHPLYLRRDVQPIQITGGE